MQGDFGAAARYGVVNEKTGHGCGACKHLLGSGSIAFSCGSNARLAMWLWPVRQRAGLGRCHHASAWRPSKGANAFHPATLPPGSEPATAHLSDREDSHTEARSTPAGIGAAAVDLGIRGLYEGINRHPEGPIQGLNPAQTEPETAPLTQHKARVVGNQAGFVLMGFVFSGRPGWRLWPGRLPGPSDRQRWRPW